MSDSHAPTAESGQRVRKKRKYGVNVISEAGLRDLWSRGGGEFNQPTPRNFPVGVLYTYSFYYSSKY